MADGRPTGRNADGGGEPPGTAMQVDQRVLAGESITLQHFTSQGGEGTVGFAGVLPGEMRALELDGTRAWFAEKEAFVAAESTVDFGIAFQGARTGTKSGEGLFLATLEGPTGGLYPTHASETPHGPAMSCGCRWGLS